MFTASLLVNFTETSVSFVRAALEGSTSRFRKSGNFSQPSGKLVIRS